MPSAHSSGFTEKYQQPCIRFDSTTPSTHSMHPDSLGSTSLDIDKVRQLWISERFAASLVFFSYWTYMWIQYIQWTGNQYHVIVFVKRHCRLLILKVLIIPCCHHGCHATAKQMYLLCQPDFSRHYCYNTCFNVHEWWYNRYIQCMLVHAGDFMARSYYSTRGWTWFLVKRTIKVMFKIGLVGLEYKIIPSRSIALKDMGRWCTAWLLLLLFEGLTRWYIGYIYSSSSIRLSALYWRMTLLVPCTWLIASSITHARLTYLHDVHATIIDMSPWIYIIS